MMRMIVKRRKLMNPFFSIWTQPSKTIRYIVEHKSVFYPLMLISVSSLGSSFMAFADTGLFANLSLSSTITLILFLSLLSGIAGWGIASFAYTWFGKLLGGTGTPQKMARAIGASTIPAIWTAPIGIIAVSLYGKHLFETPSGPFGTNMDFGFFFLQTWIIIGISIFGLIILSKGIGIVHDFSAWRGFGTIMLFTGFMFVISIIILGSLFSILLFIGVI
jgi:hypothetical protein